QCHVATHSTRFGVVWPPGYSPGIPPRGRPAPLHEWFPMPTSLHELETPQLLLDEARMRRNIQRLRDHLAPLGVPLRPHLKTAKSVDVARQLLAGGDGPATVSTLREAEHFAD